MGFSGFIRDWSALTLKAELFVFSHTASLKLVDPHLKDTKFFGSEIFIQSNFNKYKDCYCCKPIRHQAITKDL